jgi:hypothetical protein
MCREVYYEYSKVICDDYTMIGYGRDVWHPFCVFGNERLFRGVFMVFEAVLFWLVLLKGACFAVIARLSLSIPAWYRLLVVNSRLPIRCCWRFL